MKNKRGILPKHIQNKGQVTIFIIIAIIIVSAVGLFFTLRGTLVLEEIPASIEPVYNSFLACLEENVLTGVSILESQAGYIELPAFSPGSQFMPFSSQLDFLGNPIPYWYYVSGNNIQKEQVPSENDMEEQLENFIKQKITNCRFDDYYDEGFSVSFKEPEVNVNINPNNIDVSLNMNLNISKGEDNVLIRNHEVSVSSNLRSLYDSARAIYEHEQETLFLEDYAVDTLRLYAPVDGVELTCSPLTWNTNEIFDELQDAIEANTLALKIQGGLFSLADKENKYFIEDISVDNEVRFINSKNWPYAFEVNPSEGSILISKPVGNQPGLGILGFCYVPYHFVYSVKYPVLVQVSSGNEIFQFPLAVVIQGNNPREALDVSAVEIELTDLCSQKNTEIQVNIYDTKLNPVEAEISYECFGTKCDIGKTTGGTLKEEFPQCANGFIVSKSDGFKESRYMFSTIEQGTVDVIMDRVYETNVNLRIDGRDYNGQATISFIHDEGIETIVYPEQRTIKLSEGQYEIQAYIYRNSSVVLGATTQEQCVEVPQSGIGGFFGFTKERCFTIDFPEQVISNSLSGGGKQNYFILESELIGSNTVEINAESLPVVNSIEQLNNNYILFEEKGLEINFK